jgi:hypothetical protein
MRSIPTKRQERADYTLSRDENRDDQRASVFHSARARRRRDPNHTRYHRQAEVRRISITASDHRKRFFTGARPSFFLCEIRRDTQKLTGTKMVKVSSERDHVNARQYGTKPPDTIAFQALPARYPGRYAGSAATQRIGGSRVADDNAGGPRVIQELCPQLAAERPPRTPRRWTTRSSARMVSPKARANLLDHSPARIRVSASNSKPVAWTK